jgi:hypothetical protein
MGHWATTSHPSTCIEPAADLPFPVPRRTVDPVRVAAGPADRDLDLGQEELRAWIDARAAAPTTVLTAEWVNGRRTVLVPVANSARSAMWLIVGLH